MLEVVFSDSVKGSMKAAKNYKKEDMLRGAIGPIGTLLSEAESPNKFGGESINGNSIDVIGVRLCLDIGDISGEVDDEERKNLIFEMFRSPFGNNDNVIKQLERFWQTSKDDLQRLKRSAKNGEAIRIWWSDVPYEACGFYFVNSVLEDCNCEVSSIKLPKYMVQSDNSVQSYSNWAEIQPSKLYQFLPFEKKILKSERRAIAMEWAELKRENAPLRAMVNGKLISVPGDFYDYLIRVNIPNGEFMMGRFIGEIMGKTQIGVGDWWYVQRIKKMIENNEIDIVCDSEFDYRKVLKKHNSLL